MLSNPDTNDAEFEQIYKDTINDDAVFLHAVDPCFFSTSVMHHLAPTYV